MILVKIIVGLVFAVAIFAALVALTMAAIVTGVLIVQFLPRFF